MAHGTRINGTSYGITGGKCLIGGTEHSIKKGRTLIDGTGYDIQFAPDILPTFTDNTWDAIVWACHNNAVPSTWKVGNSKKAVIDGEENTVQIIGKDHDEYTDGGIAPLTFQLNYATTAKYSMNVTSTNSGGYKETKMHNVYLPEILSRSEAAIKNGVRKVNKKSKISGKVEIVSCYSFLLATCEMAKSRFETYEEGDVYDYYNNDNYMERRSRLDLSKKSAKYWSRTLSDTQFYMILGNGADQDTIARADESSIFAFCF